MNSELDYKALGAKIREVRKSRRLSQEQLSEKVGISTNYLSRVETSNGGVVSLPTLVKICNALPASMDYMLSDSLTAIENSRDKLDTSALTDSDIQYVNALITAFLQYKKQLLLSLR